ncbi:hypothetical protein PENTCL1PPCAC_11399 [Pristionchus entomophagus]|uniref:HMG box domain-containing protein n=1 Tax=Pristionchus entomophagus TaxID=358040 RepID=A0AAV5T1V8_9BILA|nr:hypothetical protein PENTCL1PPCAC_11399 [Pristionchus entomophagus]
MFRQPQQPLRPPGTQSGPEPKKAPEVPVSPYIRYCRKQWHNVRNDNPDLQMWEISRVVKEKWEGLNEDEKSPFHHEFEIEMVEYEKIVKNMNGGSAVHNAIKASLQNRVKGSGKKGEVGTTSLVSTTTNEEEQPPSELTARRMHALRFDRNHRLISDLFNASTVVDSRLVVPQKRVDLLQKQAFNLNIHKTKLEDELAKMSSEFEERKRSFQKSTEEFNEKLKKVVDERVEVSEEKYGELVNQWEGKLGEAYDEYKKKQEEMEKQLAAERERLAKTTPLLYAMTMGDEDPEKAGKEERKEKIEEKETTNDKEDEKEKKEEAQ